MAAGKGGRAPAAKASAKSTPARFQQKIDDARIAAQRAQARVDLATAQARVAGFSTKYEYDPKTGRESVKVVKAPQ